MVQNMLYLPKIRALASPFHVFFHIVCPFSYFHLFFIHCRTFYQTWHLSFQHYINFSYVIGFEWRICFIHSTIHPILMAKYSFKKIFIVFREALFKFKISFIKKKLFFRSKKLFIFLKSRLSSIMQGVTKSEIAPTVKISATFCWTKIFCCCPNKLVFLYFQSCIFDQINTFDARC